jgi:hypothetical protein
MAFTLRKTRVVGNPAKKYKKRRKNPGDILGFSLAAAGNPGRRGKKMAKKKYAKKHASGRRQSNPARKHSAKGRRKMSTRRYRRNAGSFGGGFGPVLTMSISAIAGALGSKLGAQMALGAKNTGLLGYGANAGVGVALWMIADKVFKSRTAATGVAVGTGIQILLRAINDYTPFGQYINQLGMGDYQMQSFVTPQVLVDPVNSAEVAIPNGWAPQVALPAPAAAAPPAAGGSNGVAGLYGGAWPGLYGN